MLHIYIGKRENITLNSTVIKINLLYGVETWKIKKDNNRKLKGIELRVFRRLPRLLWLDGVKHKWRLKGIGGILHNNIKAKQLM